MAEEEYYYSWRVVSWHPCDYLIEQLLNAVACCLGFCQPTQPHPQQQQGSHAADDPPGDDPLAPKAAARRRPRQPKPSEGRGGQIN